MTALDDRPSTATGPTARTVTRSARGPVLLGLAVVLVVALVALLSGARGGGRLDPRSYGPGGTHALAALLERAGTPVQVVGDVGEATSVPGATVVVPFPTALTSEELSALSAVPLVVLGADQGSVDALGIDAGTTDAGGTGSLRPGCSLEVAQRAGSVRLGGVGYASGAATAACYPRGGTPTLLQVGTTTLLGSGDLLTNARLDQDGNAALAVGLLHPATKVLWLIPRGDRAVTGDRRTLRELLPEGFDEALLQGAVALVLLALWRARRLGRVVVEPLPVVVRAAEAVEGRGRLYRSANARDRAAEALRSASRDAAARRLGLGPTGSPDALVQAAAERTGTPAADVHALLYGPVPVDDPSLVRLADALSRFDQEVAGS